MASIIAGAGKLTKQRMLHSLLRQSVASSSLSPLSSALLATQHARAHATAAAAVAAQRFHAAKLPPVAPRIAPQPWEDEDVPVLAKVSMKPHPKKQKGEDACCIASGSQYLVAGIADGVGAWIAQGIDSGAYSRELMSHVEAHASNALLRSNPIDLLGRAHTSMAKDTLGSCTACIVVFEGNKLKYANLGDSGLIGYRVRDRSQFIRSTEKQHRFNCPYQLGSLEHSDRAADADVAEVEVQPLDLVVLGTDGLFDNLHDGTIIATIRDFVSMQERPHLWPSVRVGAPPSPSSHTSSPSSSSSSLTASAIKMAGLEANETGSVSAAPLSPRSVDASAATTRSPSPACSVSSAASSATSSIATAAAAAASARDYHPLSEDALQALAHLLVSKAHETALSRTALTPFNERMQVQLPKMAKMPELRGGKLDDISVVVCQVKRMWSDESPPQPSPVHAS